MSIRSVARIANVSRNTVAKLLADAGKACANYQDKALRNLPCKRIQADEIWSFVYAKAKNVARAKNAPPEAGDVWTWTAICADTKLVPSWRLGDRSGATALDFMDDLKGRLANRVQLTTDGHRAYLEAVEEDVERQNLTMRMSMRRFTRLTNAFSKRLEYLSASVALHFMHYNFCRIHKTLRVTPAMEAGVTDRLWEIGDIVDMVEADAAKPNRPATYEKRGLISN